MVSAGLSKNGGSRDSFKDNRARNQTGAVLSITHGVVEFQTKIKDEERKLGEILSFGVLERRGRRGERF